VVLGVFFDRRATPVHKQMVYSKTDENMVECRWYSKKYQLPNRLALPLLRVGVSLTSKCQLLPELHPSNDHFTDHTVIFDMVSRSDYLLNFEWKPLTVHFLLKISNALNSLAERWSRSNYDWLIFYIDNYLEGNRWHDQPLA